MSFLSCLSCPPDLGKKAETPEYLVSGSCLALRMQGGFPKPRVLIKN